MSMPVARRFHPKGKLCVAHRHSYTIVEPFVGSSTQWGSLSSSTSPIIFFLPFGTLSFQCCRWEELTNFWWVLSAIPSPFCLHDGWFFYFEFLHGVYPNKSRLLGVSSRIWHLWYSFFYSSSFLTLPVALCLNPFFDIHTENMTLSGGSERALRFSVRILFRLLYGTMK